MSPEEANGYLMRGLEWARQKSQSIQAALNTQPLSHQKRAALNRELARIEQDTRGMLTAHLGQEQADLLWVTSQLEAANSTATPTSEN